MLLIVIACAYNVSQSNDYAFNAPQGNTRVVISLSHANSETLITAIQHNWFL